MNALRWLDHALLLQRGHLFPWVPVCLALGIGGYFSLRIEPGMQAYAVIGALGLCAALVALRWPGGLASLVWAVALVATGFTLAGARAHGVAGPQLGWRYYGPVEGRVIAIDRSASDALRLTLDRVVLRDLDPEKTPSRVRVSLHGQGAVHLPPPGTRVMTTAHLMPPQGPAEPGGFDFRRHAWFQQLGAVGYTRLALLRVHPAGPALGLQRLRLRIAEHLQAALPGDTGGVAAAVTTGLRAGISQSTLEALRASNLAHLLAISGLHMGLLAGFVFGALRLGMALIPPLALRLPVRKIAALGALAAASAYLALSGGNVATERAFVMVAVALCALLIDRRAISLRAVAMAAIIVLCLRPEALLSPGFQMSFAATTALVFVFGRMRDGPSLGLPRWGNAVLGVALSSAIAGLATAPVGAAHFNTLSHYGLIANLVSVPLMGLVVIPSAVLAGVLSLIGLEAVGLIPMGLALDWILGVADQVSTWPGARGHVTAPGPLVLPMLALGLLWLALWQGWARVIGLGPAVLAFWLWSGTERPQILISGTGSLVGVMTEHGRALSRAKGAGFVAGIWLENDGDGALQAEAAARWPGAQNRLRIFEQGETRLIHVMGKRAAQALEGCYAGDWVVASVPLDLPPDCRVLDADRLRDTGSVALWSGRLITARAHSGDRLWTR